MASPQKENGYVAIANEIIDALSKIRISGEAMQVLLHIFRKTYGFNKTQDFISLSQFAIATGLKKNSVCKAIKKLKQLNLISQKGYSTGIIYRFNKDFDTWTPLPKKHTSIPKSERGVSQKVNKEYPKKDTTKDRKTILQKTLGAALPPNPENELIQFFREQVNPHLKFNNKTERQACNDLIKSYGIEKTKNAFLFLQEKRKTDKYLPLITTPYELWVKWAKIKQYLESEQIKKKGKIWKPSQLSALPTALSTK